MVCPKCGKELPDNAVFCGGCGTKMNNESAPPVATVPRPEYTGAAGPSYSAGMGAGSVNPAPAGRSMLILNTKRAWWKMFLLGLITLGIYPAIAKDKMINELNITASRYDGEQTCGLSSLGMLSAITLGIYSFVWNHTYANRLGRELRRRGIYYKISAADFWIFNILLFFTIVCPIIYSHKVIKATNLINENFNRTGM